MQVLLRNALPAYIRYSKRDMNRWHNSGNTLDVTNLIIEEYMGFKYSQYSAFIDSA